ncbi:MAG TPA: CsiV family protein [Gammaproteobacteria bacterium]|nr:CsiV family protein [Gammaproteobacteria bacterium]
MRHTYKLTAVISLMVALNPIGLAEDLNLLILRNIDETALPSAHPNWQVAEQFKGYETISSEPINWQPYQKLKNKYSILATHTWPINDDEQTIGFKTYDQDSVIMGEITIKKERFYETKLNIIELNHRNYFSMNQSRRVSLNQINYFDHARFGVIVQITPEIKTRSTNASVS